MKTSKAGIGRSIAAVGIVALALTAAACDEEDSGNSINTTEKFCASVKDVDDKFQTADEDSSDFANYKKQYADINKELERLLSAIDVVEEENRDAVESTLNWAHDLTELVADADSQEDLEDQLFAEDGIFARAEELDPAGEQWISDTCGVEIDDEG